MEPEAIFFADTGQIKQEPQSDIKEEQLDCEIKHEDCVPEENVSISEVHNPLNVVIIKEEHKSEPSDSDGEETATTAELDPLSYLAVGIKDEILLDCSSDVTSLNTIAAHDSDPDQGCKERDQSRSDQYSCNTCNKLFTKLKNLKIHLRIHSDQRPYACKICSKSFKLRGSLTRHIITHAAEGPHKCNVCNKSYTTLENVRIHMRSHTGERPYMCEVCNKSFSQRGNLMTHVRSHIGERKYTCEICNTSYVESATLKRHMTRKHSGKRNYKCEVCGYSFPERGCLKRHMQIHADKEKCKFCDSLFRSPESLERHVVLRHFEKQLYTCKLCNELYTVHGSIKVHECTHSGHGLYTCVICNNSFSALKSVTSHMHTHSEVGDHVYAKHVINPS